MKFVHFQCLQTATTTSSTSSSFSETKKSFQGYEHKASSKRNMSLEQALEANKKHELEKESHFVNVLVSKYLKV